MVLRNRNGKPPAPPRLDEMPDDGTTPGELPGVWEYLFGGRNTVELAKVSRIPKHMVLPICNMRMQARLALLTGGDDDPDLQECFERDMEELMIGLEGEGRRDAVTIAAAEGAEEEDEETVKFWGNM